MFFLQASKAPVAVTIEDEVYLVPKMRMKDVTEWGAKIQSAKEAQLTAGMDATKRQEYLTFYGVPMPDINEFRALSVTLDGADYILKTQLAKARTEDGRAMTVQDIDILLDSIPLGTKAQLAYTIGDMADTSQKNVKAKKELDTTNPPTGSNG